MSRRAASMAAMAKRATNPQDIQAIQKSLVEGVQNGSIQPYVGIPLIQDLTKKMTEAKAKMAQAMTGAGMQPPQGGAPIAQQVMQQAAQESQGLEALPSNLPQEYAGGGIIAFEEGGPVERFQVGGQPKYESVYDRYNRLKNEREKAEAEAQARLTPEQRIRQDRASMMQPFAAAGDIVGGPYNYLAQTGESLANAVGIPRIGKALGIYDSDVTSIGIPRIGQGGNTPFMDMTRQYAAGQTSPATPAPINKDLGPVPGTTNKDVLGGRSNSAVPAAPLASAPGAGQKPGINTLAGAPTRNASAFGMPVEPSYEQTLGQITREEMLGLKSRTKTGIDELIAAQSKNKLEGKAFDDLKKNLEEEAKQAGMDKSDARAMAIFKAGLSIMGGTSRNALENIGKGAMVGAEDYQKANSELKKAEKERQKQFAAIEEARRAEDRDDIRGKNAALEKAYTANQNVDQLTTQAVLTATGKERDLESDIFKTKYAGAKGIEAANIQANATRDSANIQASARVQAAELKAALAGETGTKGLQAVRENLAKDIANDIRMDPATRALKQQQIDAIDKQILTSSGYRGPAAIAPLPANPSISNLTVGTIYQTAKGPAKWTGTGFMPI
jgi:hypothetical protein